ncbi:MAG: BNR-4 repeat-containing protein [Verrucomicrobia bacterium]|nr:BNR-4 repeat-containing protein [Verrucomicrobiota bacterium]
MRTTLRILRSLLFVAALLLDPPATRAEASPPAGELLFGGCGGVYFLAEPGELTVEVVKRDRNQRDTRVELRAILAGPDRRVLQEATIPDDGRPRGSGMEPAQRCRLSTRVEHKGVYVLNVTLSQDRYGEHAVWGFRSNCPKYLIETARGHRDARHEEPIVLASPERAGDVCFMPRRGAFDIEVAGLPKDAATPQVFDAKGALIAALKPGESGNASGSFAASKRREATPWRLHFESAKAIVNMDGVTRWDDHDLQPNLACWTPDLASWFPLLENRWLLTPCSRTVYGQPGEQKEIALQVRNDAARERTIQLSLDVPAGNWPARLSAERVKLGGKKVTTITVTCMAPATGETRVCHVRATPLDESGFSTCSTLTVKAGEAPAKKPLVMPLVLKPYQHENEQFGHLPEFPTESQVYFDLKNQPFIITGNGIATWRDGRWTAFKPKDVSSPLCSKIAFDRDNNLYALATVRGSASLLHSADGGKTFAACAIPGRAGSFDTEEFTGHNLPDGPPPILRYRRTAKDPKLFWRALHDLELFLPKKVDDGIVMGEPLLISKQCIGLAAHSGIPSSVVSRGSKVHVIWGEATDPKVKVAGVPAFVATYDRETGKLGRPALIGYGAPPNDIHNTPSITMDSRGFLHALAGTHGRPFPYARSLNPNDAGGGWTEAAPMVENLNQTYIGMVCGPDDTLHATFRLWQTGMEPFPASHYATLAYQRKRPGQPWEPPRILIMPPFSEYSVFYHRLTMDRKGRLFLSYDYWSTFWFYRNDHFGRRRTLLMSPDGGDTWKLAQSDDLR